MRISVIGCGNLGTSLIRGFIKSGVIKPENMTASDPDRTKLGKLEKLGLKTTTDNQTAVERSNVIILSVKPGHVRGILEKLDTSNEKLIISTAAGVSTKSIERYTDARIIRIMPNICSRVNQMAAAYTLGRDATEEDEKTLKNLMSELGMTVRINEELMDAVTALSASGPAFVLLIIKAMKKAGIELGLKEDIAHALASQTVKGTGELALNSEEGLQELIDIITTPNGTTIQGMDILEKERTHKAFGKAVKAAAERARQLSSD